MKQQPLLMEELSDVQRASLVSLVQHPGWSVLELLHASACKRATDAVIQVNPEDMGSDRTIALRQLKARERNEFSLLILGSIEWHIQAAQLPQQEAQEAKQQQNRIVQGLTNE